MAIDLLDLAKIVPPFCPWHQSMSMVDVELGFLFCSRIINYGKSRINNNGVLVNW